MADGQKKVSMKPQEFNYRIVDGVKVCDVREPIVNNKGGEVIATAVAPK